jgi:deoxyribodipyrimidine photolyase
MPLESIPPAAVVWFRRDLRLSDNPALEAAARIRVLAALSAVRTNS